MRHGVLFATLLLAAATAAAQTPDAGRPVFTARCAGCHGSDGNGGELGPAIATRVPTRTDEDLTSLFRQGLPAAGMPALPNLSDGETTATLIQFLRTLKPRAGSAPERATVTLAGGASLDGLVLNQERVRPAAARRRPQAPPAAQERRRRVSRRHLADRLAQLQRRTQRQPLQHADADHEEQRRALAPKWIFSLPNTSHLQVTPIVSDGVMYVTSANECYALDAGIGREIWHYQRPRTKGLVGNAAGGINRGVAVAGDRAVHGHRPRARHRAQPLHRRAALGNRDGRLAPELQRHRRAAGRRQSRRHRHVRRR